MSYIRLLQDFDFERGLRIWPGRCITRHAGMNCGL